MCFGRKPEFIETETETTNTAENPVVAPAEEEVPGEVVETLIVIGL